MTASELDVLKPIDPSITNSDDYEIFTLNNACVFHENGKTASLLHAYADTPLRVEGRLEPLHRSQAKYLLKRSSKSLEIEIRNVTRFSYGQTQDGETLIWALGAAGWFELRPRKEYQELFDDMVQAVEALYFVTDIYNEPRKRGGGPNVQLVFQEYAEDQRFACNDPEEAADIFYRHRIFLLMCFLNKAQDFNWLQTTIYQYYKRQYPRDWEKAKARVEGKTLDLEDKASKAITTASKADNPKSQPKPKQNTAQREAPKRDDNWWEATAIFEFMQKAVNQGVMHVGHITLDRVAKYLFKRYEIENVDLARHVLLVHATNLCYIMNHPRRKTIKFFASERIYKELSAGHTLSALETRKAEGIPLKPRRDHSSLKEDYSEESDDEPSELETPQRRPPRKKRGMLSVLRPKNSKYSGKGKSVKPPSTSGKEKVSIITVTTDEELDATTISQSENDSEGASGIDTPTHHILPGKRKHALESDQQNPRKRAASSSTIGSSSSDEESAETPTEPTLPIRHRSGEKNNKTTSVLSLSPAIVSSSLPQYTANASDGSWTCTFDGCSCKIYGGKSEVGRALIHEHLEDHAKGRQREIGILMAEESKLRLPVDHLIRKIREMADQQTPLFPALETTGLAMAQRRPIERNI